jgi:hypothetical protein
VHTDDDDNEGNELEKVARAARQLLLLSTRQGVAVQQPPHNFPSDFEFCFEQFEASPVPEMRVTPSE